MTRPTQKKIATTISSLLADLGSDASRRGYTTDWAKFTAWLKASHLDVLKVTPKDVKRYVLHLAKAGMALRTRGRALSVIRRCYGAMVADELLAVNPAREVRNTKQGKTSEPVTWLEEAELARFLAFGMPTYTASASINFGGEGEIDVSKGARMKVESSKSIDTGAFLLKDRPVLESVFMATSPDALEQAIMVERARQQWADRRNRMCIQLLAGTGRRRSEIARMCVQDVGERGITGVVKGGGIKTAPVPSWLRDEIAVWCSFAGLSGADPLLPWSAEDKTAVNGDAVYAIVKRVAGAVGIDPAKISPHGLRRTLATLSERRRVPLRDIQAQLGHENQGTTESYLHGSRKVEQAPGEWMSELTKSKETT